ncbi:MAG: phosphohydrolase [Alteromonadaceae bacterium]|nr:MAG: phosphohydrolase [Alteromonadaceae bacterium]
MAGLKRVYISNLEVGMYVAQQSEGVADGKMMSQGFIRRVETIGKLKSKGIRELIIDTDKGIDSVLSIPLIEKAKPLVSRVKLDEERDKAEKIYGEARCILGNLLSNVKMGKSIDVSAVTELAENIDQSVLNNPNALLCLSQIREKDTYLLEHSINVGILMNIFSSYLGFERNTVIELTTGAVLHDIGKIRVASSILNKSGKLTPSEWEEMKRHVTYGEEVLLNSTGMTDISRSVCSFHHERLDGSGYPRGLKEDEVPIYGRMASVVDIYDAVTAERVYHKGMCPFTAMRFLKGLTDDNHLDKSLVYGFIRCMNVYPVGTLVELSNGRLAIVVETNSSKPDKPRVKSFYSLTSRLRESAKMVNLAAGDHAPKIVATRLAEDFSFNVAEYF